MMTVSFQVQLSCGSIYIYIRFRVYGVYRLRVQVPNSHILVQQHKGVTKRVRSPAIGS